MYTYLYISVCLCCFWKNPLYAYMLRYAKTSRLATCECPAQVLRLQPNQRHGAMALLFGFDHG